MRGEAIARPPYELVRGAGCVTPLPSTPLPNNPA